MADELRERVAEVIRLAGDPPQEYPSLNTSDLLDVRRDWRLNLADAVLAALDLDDPAVLRQMLTRADGTHRYLATGCLHGHHDHCRCATSITGGDKEPGTCKWCPARCVCDCHQDGEGTG